MVQIILLLQLDVVLVVQHYSKMILIEGCNKTVFIEIASAEFWTIMLLLGIFLETLLQTMIKPSYAWKSFSANYLRGKKRDIISEIREYSTRALNLAGLTFAGISLLIGTLLRSQQSIRNPLLMFIFALTLFLVSYKLDVFSAKKKVIWWVQQRLLNYGLLGLIIGLGLLFTSKIKGTKDYIFLLMGIVLIIHLIEYYYDYKLTKKEAEIDSQKKKK